MSKAHNVYLVQIHFVKPITQCDDALMTIKRSIIRPIMDAQDTPYTLTFVERHSFGAKALLKRFDSVGKHPDVAVIRVIPTSVNQASSLGFLDPITSKVEVAWGKNAKALEAEKLKSGNGVFVDQRKGASRKSRAGFSRQR